jgi:dihydroxyacid dehydratase/phosphogluconate dehydratase
MPWWRSAAATEHARGDDRHRPPDIPRSSSRGTIKAGNWKGVDLTVVSVFEAVGTSAAGTSAPTSTASAQRLPRRWLGGGMYTANTMSSAIKAIGMSRR